MEGILRRIGGTSQGSCLVRGLRYGTRASRLMRYSPELVELVLRAQDYPELGMAEKTIRTEQLIREAIASIGGPEAEALLILFCLNPARPE